MHKLIALFFILLLFFCVERSKAFAIDGIEKELSESIRKFAEVKLKEDLSEAEKGYLYFLLAIYKRDSQARKQAEEIFNKLNIPESQAYLGCIETLKARDFLDGGILQTIGNLTPLGFVRIKYVQDGIEKLDKAVNKNPCNLNIRLIRAVTYSEIPTLFKKFEEGLKDIKIILERLNEGEIAVPDEDEFFRDKSYVYYNAGRCFLKAGEKDKAKELFLKSTELSTRSPFAIAAGRELFILK